MEDKQKHTHDNIKGLVLDENEARKLRPKVIFTRLSESIRIGVDPVNRKQVYFEVLQKGKKIKFAIPTNVMIFETDEIKQIWDEEHEETIENV